jgi:pyruvate dehydrogenase E2 component (dihydrolipoamide acetyltransferase)
MAVGASKPTVVTDKDGFFSVKSKMQVSRRSDSFKYHPYPYNVKY